MINISLLIAAALAAPHAAPDNPQANSAFIAWEQCIVQGVAQAGMGQIQVGERARSIAAGCEPFAQRFAEAVSHGGASGGEQGHGGGHGPGHGDRVALARDNMIKRAEMMLLARSTGPGFVD